MISPPKFITPTLCRFSISQYAPQPDEYHAWLNAWEKIAEVDPYFHLRTEILDGKEKRKVVTTDGGWVGLNRAAELRHMTGSIGAILRADHFIAQATVPPRYHELAGIPATEQEFLESLGVDSKTIEKLRANAGANLIISQVTFKPRRVIWSQGPLGGVYATLDVESVDATRDPIRRPISAEGLALKYDASEWFAVAPNGMWRTAIFDAAGKRQDAVPDRVAKDTSDPHGDGIVVPMLSCIRCHRESGLRPFEDDQSKLIARGLGPHSYDPAIALRAKEFYDEPRLKRQMEFDQATYQQAVKRATDLDDAEKISDEIGLVYRRFAYDLVTTADAAREVGQSVQHFRESNVATRDPILLVLVEGRPILRGQWESSFQEAALRAAEREKM